MRNYQQNHINKAIFALLCTTMLSSEVNCTDVELGDTTQKELPKNSVISRENVLEGLVRDEIAESTRKAVPNFAGFLSLSLGSISFLGSLSAESVKIIGTTGSCISVIGASSNLYNWYRDGDSVESGWYKLAHGTLNGLVVLSNLASASLGFTSVYSNDPYEKNACGVASLVVGASGLFFKGIDLFLTQSPSDNHKCKMARAMITQNARD